MRYNTINDKQTPEQVVYAETVDGEIEEGTEVLNAEIVTPQQSETENGVVSGNEDHVTLEDLLLSDNLDENRLREYILLNNIKAEINSLYEGGGENRTHLKKTLIKKLNSYGMLSILNSSPSEEFEVFNGEFILDLMLKISQGNDKSTVIEKVEYFIKNFQIDFEDQQEDLQSKFTDALRAISGDVSRAISRQNSSHDILYYFAKNGFVNGFAKNLSGKKGADIEVNDVEAQRRVLSFLLRVGRFSDDLYSLVLCAAEHRQLEFLKFLHNHGVNLDVENYYHKRPIHIAIKNGDTPTFEYLLSLENGVRLTKNKKGVVTKVADIGSRTSQTFLNVVSSSIGFSGTVALSPLLLAYHFASGGNVAEIEEMAQGAYKSMLKERVHAIFKTHDPSLAVQAAKYDKVDFLRSLLDLGVEIPTRSKSYSDEVNDVIHTRIIIGKNVSELIKNNKSDVDGAILNIAGKLLENAMSSLSDDPKIIKDALQEEKSRNIIETVFNQLKDDLSSENGKAILACSANELLRGEVVNVLRESLHGIVETQLSEKIAKIQEPRASYGGVVDVEDYDSNEEENLVFDHRKSNEGFVRNLLNRGKQAEEDQTLLPTRSS